MFWCLCLCVGVFTDLGGGYSVVRESLLYKSLCSWRRLLLPYVNRPAVHPVLLTNTLHRQTQTILGIIHMFVCFIWCQFSFWVVFSGWCACGSECEVLYWHCQLWIYFLNETSGKPNAPRLSRLLLVMRKCTYADFIRLHIPNQKHPYTLITEYCATHRNRLADVYRELECMGNFSSMNESFCYHRHTDLHVT